MKENNLESAGSNTNQNPPGLTRKRAAEIAGAYGRYLELSELLKSAVITPETESRRAEHSGLEKFLGSALLIHGGELLGCYNLVHSEYEPVLQSVAIIFRRIGLLPPPATPQ